jgi:hypothetical protein
VIVWLAHFSRLSSTWYTQLVALTSRFDVERSGFQNILFPCDIKQEGISGWEKSKTGIQIASASCSPCSPLFCASDTYFSFFRHHYSSHGST